MSAALSVAAIVGLSACSTGDSDDGVLTDGTYQCHGETHINTLLDASAEVVDGKIRPGLTGTDIYVGHKVMSWGRVRPLSSSTFSVEMTPTPEVADDVGAPFWIKCRIDDGP